MNKQIVTQLLLPSTIAIFINCIKINKRRQILHVESLNWHIALGKTHAIVQISSLGYYNHMQQWKSAVWDITLLSLFVFFLDINGNTVSGILFSSFLSYHGNWPQNCIFNTHGSLHFLVIRSHMQSDQSYSLIIWLSSHKME